MTRSSKYDYYIQIVLLGVFILVPICLSGPWVFSLCYGTILPEACVAPLSAFLLTCTIWGACYLVEKFTEKRNLWQHVERVMRMEESQYPVLSFHDTLTFLYLDQDYAQREQWRFPTAADRQS